jgi:hypothetical protein
MVLMAVRSALRDNIIAQMRKVSDELSSGRAADYAEYKRLVGIIQGLKKALDAIDDQFNKILDEGE